ncbi:MAG: hypothetical protein QG597_4528 [Actinomycetota bacterium]|nr:hypothetical protein [Actinomycetota bacterium]
MLEVATAPRYEAGQDLPSGFVADRVAIMAHFSPDARITRSVQTLSERLVGHGYHVIIMSSSEVASPLAWPAAVPAGVTVYRRPNVGYDFGSWAAALALHPGISRAADVILLNDSLLGPFAPIAGIIESFESAPVDIWGLVDSTHVARHLQSYWVGYRGGVLAEPPLRQWWQDIRVEPTKQAIINRYEVGAMRYWRRNGYAVGVGFPYDLVVRDGFNPASFGWRRLLEFGYPFVKREIAVNPPPEIRDGHQVREVILARFGEDIEEWV